MEEKAKYPVHYNRTLNPLYWCGAACSELGALVWRLLIRAPLEGITHGLTRNKDLGKLRIGVGMVIILQTIIMVALFTK